jgi:ribosomal protein S18 acetylase RimI-like enzyme
VVRVLEASTDAQIDVVRTLFAEYAESLGIDLSFQDFAAELAGLPGAYAPPGGVLLLAFDEERPVGCVGLRPTDWPRIAELKRLYVRPEGRGLGLGSSLTAAALQAALDAGYERVRLDTLACMESAQRLYERFGFRDIPAYRFNPIESARFMEVQLPSGQVGDDALE